MIGRALRGVPLPRRTILHTATVEGSGLFTGGASAVTFAPGDSGIVMRRAGEGGIAATLEAVAKRPAGTPGRNTVLGEPGREFVTTEHVLSAVVGLGITDLVIELRGAEFPILDGSSEPFARALWEAGLRYAGSMVEPIVLPREIVVKGAKGETLTARPRETAGCSFTYHLDYGAAIPAQSATFDSTQDSYMEAIAPARTFCLKAEAEAMQAAGLFKGLTARDLLVIGERGPIDNAYRFENEPARHKVLDMMGDLALVGRAVQADFVGVRSGHGMNREMGRRIGEEVGAGS